LKDSWYYCLDACPTSYTATDGICAIDADKVKVLSLNFNVPTNVYTKAADDKSVFDATSVMVGTAGYPAKNRGVHFAGKQDGDA
jgi:hypothetical protein